ncbi:MAG: hypothetical protein IJ529_05930 [Alphaproteobacteria bacterium]|nr:hypothetical protein [Alphaproteobacteria bacterium]MBQ9234970.1 hypothetical protein [Alphaproteobacteria bacterium]
MTEEHQICVKQILDRVTNFIYRGVLYSIAIAMILGIGLLFLYPHYQEYARPKECLQNGHQQDWCEKTGQKLSALD